LIILFPEEFALEFEQDYRFYRLRIFRISLKYGESGIKKRFLREPLKKV